MNDPKLVKLKLQCIALAKMSTRVRCEFLMRFNTFSLIHQKICTRIHTTESNLPQNAKTQTRLTTDLENMYMLCERDDDNITHHGMVRYGFGYCSCYTKI